MVSLDLFAFSQQDQDKDPLRNQSFNYGAISLEGRVQLVKTVAIRGNAALSYIATGERPEFPKSITNAKTTRASPDVLVLDSALTVDIRPKGSPWTVSIGGFYHHQFGFISPGVDLSLRGEFFGGDSIVFMSYSLRPSVPHFRLWDDRQRGEDIQLTNNFLIGWTQTLSPSWVMSLSAQYVRQDGLLRGAFHFVALLDDKGQPELFTDEIVPRQRNRVQLNARVRYSPILGVSIGLDASGYYDDWDILHGALQINVEFPVGRYFRWRIWYRVAAQREARFFVHNPTQSQQFQTQDSDLGSFVLHAPGMLLLFPLGETGPVGWVLRAALLGFYRDDNIFAFGGKLGVIASW